MSERVPLLALLITIIIERTRGKTVLSDARPARRPQRFPRDVLQGRLFHRPRHHNEVFERFPQVLRRVRSKFPTR